MGKLVEGGKHYGKAKGGVWKGRVFQGLQRGSEKMKTLRVLLLWLLPVLFLPPSGHGWECSVSIDGPHWVKMGGVVTLKASGLPEGGQYHWSATPNLVPHGDSATLTGFEPTFSESIRVTVRYDTPRGKSCRAIKWVYVYMPCEVVLSGPAEAEPGEEVLLAAAGAPEGGAFEWRVSRGSGAITGHEGGAVFRGDQPGEVVLEATYTPPDGGRSCKGHHVLEISEKCSVSIYGAVAAPLGETVPLLAAGTPENGTYQWVPLEGLNPKDPFSHAQTASGDYTPHTAGHHTIQIHYTTPAGQSCQGSHELIAYKLESLSPRFACFDSGTTLSLSDFQLLTFPEGYENTVSFVPQTLWTLFQTQDVTVTGSCGKGHLNSAATTVQVVNKDSRQEVSVLLEVPNLVNDALKMMGVGEATDLRLATDFARFMECCAGASIRSSTTGSVGMGLHVDGGPFTIVGIPMPPAIREYVTLDALAVGVSGQARVSMKGEHHGCTDLTHWSGSGDIVAGIDVGGEVKAHNPKETIVLQGALKGESSVSQTIRVESPDMILSGKWNGLNVYGNIEMRIYNMKFVEYKVSGALFVDRELDKISIKLPELK